jgi:hypothetical protein
MPLLIIKYVNIVQTDQWDSPYAQASLGVSIILVAFNGLQFIHRMFQKDIDPILLYLCYQNEMDVNSKDSLEILSKR